METGNKFFDLTYIHKYNLSVFLSKGGFCFVVSDENDTPLLNKTVPLNQFSPLSQQYRNIINANKFLTEKFASVKILFRKEKYSFVPKEFFSPETVGNFYEFNLGPLCEEEKLLFCPSSVAGLYAVFAFDKLAIEMLENTFEDALFGLTVTNMMDELGDEGVVLGDCVFANFRDKLLEIVVFHNGKLMAANTFAVNSDEDILYFILYAFNNYKLDGDFVPLTLYGDVQPSSSIFQIVPRYIKNFITPDENNKRFF
ncbi:MAG: DUF3822 family protein [Bacteroidales bacterium]|nr:DUF3822 family protein [Bacteroidales bacterium]